MAASAIEFKDVSYFLKSGRQIINNVNFSIAVGETVVLLGRSGSGKTTILKLINRLIEASEGQILVEGKATGEWDPIALRRNIGYVIQEIGLFPHFTVSENVALVPSLQGWPAERTSARVKRMLELVGLEPGDFANRYPDELSGGQRQRVGVARALAGDPSILLMDEPFGALDLITRSEIQNEFKDLSGQLNKTIVLVTHDVKEAFALGDRIGLMETGKLVALEDPELFKNLDNPEVQVFLAPV